MAVNELLSEFDRSTRGRLNPNWEQNMKVIDLVNKDPYRAAQYLLPTVHGQLKSKDPRIQWLTLILLDALVKNCGIQFARAIGTKEIMHRLKMLVYRRWKKRKKPYSQLNNYKNFVGEKAVTMIQMWGIGFYASRFEVPIFYNTYRRLVKKGIKFPEPKEDEKVPVQTPARNVHAGPIQRQTTGARREFVQRTVNDPIPEKVLREVKNAEDQIALLNDILAQLGGPNSSSAKNNDMVKEMVKKLKDTSNNLQRLVNDNIDKEKALAALLAINDKLEKALRPFVKADEDSDDEESDSSDDDTDTADTDDDELFRKNYIERGYTSDTAPRARGRSTSNLGGSNPGIYSTSPNRASVSFMSQPTSPMQTATPGLINPFAQVATPSQPQPGLYGYNVTSANQLSNPFAQMTVSSQPNLNVGSPQNSYLSGMSQPNMNVGSPQNSYVTGANGNSGSFNMYSNPNMASPSNGFGSNPTTSNPTTGNNTGANPFAAPDQQAPRNPFSDDFSSYKIKGAEDFSKMTAEEIDQFTSKQRTLANTFGKYFYDETPGANNNAPGQPSGSQPGNNTAAPSANANQRYSINPFENQAGGNYNVNAQNGASFPGNNNAMAFNPNYQPNPQLATSPPKNVNPFL
eukprot:TRINITY_DN11417_c0_g1_i1.p1 TRINITY_DN11417_c0_g1~~TRINITY_DN11417_c0_g1_i1.p1  ORF type:complete len:629 (-),score=219.47 TRINITY_DN11417_c0_g1_i1:72-1958(-)